MPIDSCLLLLVGCFIMSIIMSLFAQICSCYFPTLLSWRIYYVVKNPRLQKLLISPQRNRDISSKSAPKDRNKMAFLGCAAWAVNILWMIAAYSILIYWIVVALTCPQEIIDMAFEKYEPLFSKLFSFTYLYSMPFWIVFYQLDYSLGMRFHSKKSEHK